MSDEDRIPDPEGEPVAVDPTALKWAKTLGVATFRLVGYGTILLGVGIIVPQPCMGAQSSVRLEWVERDQLIDQAISNETNQPPKQP